MSVWSTLGGLAGGIWSAVSGSKYQKQLMNMYKPYIRAARWALPQYQAAIQKYLIPQANMLEDPMLRAKYLREVGNIGKQYGRLMGQALSYWQQRGNIGRARGELLRAQEAQAEQLGNLGLSYQAQQLARQQQAQSGLIGALQTLGTLGAQALGGASEAISSRAGEVGQGLGAGLAYLLERYGGSRNQLSGIPARFIVEYQNIVKGGAPLTEADIPDIRRTYLEYLSYGGR